MAVPTYPVRPFLFGNLLIATSLLFFLVPEDIVNQLESEEEKGPLRMSSVQRFDKDNKSPPVVSEEAALVIYAALLAIWIGCLLWSSLTSSLPTVPGIFAWDKMHHFIAYAILMLFSGLFLKTLLRNRFRGWIIAFIFSLSFGLLMEIGQATISTRRHADWKDFIANSLGAGLVLAIALLKKKKS